MKRYIRSLALALALCVSVPAMTGCALRQGEVLAPNALSTLDSRAFVTLGTTAAVLEELKKDCPSATCPAAKKAALNKVIEAYNVARDSWLAYRVALQSGAKPSDAALIAGLGAVTSAMKEFGRIK